MNGGLTNHCTKRVSDGGGWASRRYFVHAASGSIFSYINNPDGTGYSVNIGIAVKIIDYSRSFCLFVFGWERETTETAMGAIFVHARSLWVVLVTQNMVKIKKRVFETYVFRCLGMFGAGVISVPVGGRNWLSGCGWGAASSPKTILNLLGLVGHLFEV